MSNPFCSYTGIEWENFCETMLRYHYGAANFYQVPDQDEGDFGIEFFTVDGTLFQCYQPEAGVEMELYKKKLKTKINDDLNKLEKYKDGIAKLLDSIVIKQWVLLTPEDKSKDLIAYCNKKKKDVKAKALTFIDNSCFTVKIETAESYPSARLYALNVSPCQISIELVETKDEEKGLWVGANSEFLSNVERKTNALLDVQDSRFKDTVIKKYIQVTKFLDKLRNDYPDLHALLEDSARAQLEALNTNSLLQDWDRNFIQQVISGNRDAFAKYSDQLCDSNREVLPFGYLSKWLAECYLGFAIHE